MPSDSRSARICSSRLFKAALFGTAMVGVVQLHPQPNTLQSIRDRGVLEVVAQEGQSTLRQQGDVTSGLQYELIRLFAEELGVQLRIERADAPAAVLHAIRRNNADLAITGLSSDDPRLKRLRITQPVQLVTRELIGRKDSPAVPELTRAAAVVVVAADSSEAHELRLLTKQNRGLQVLEVVTGNAGDLLDMVRDGRVDYAVLGAQDFSNQKTLYPDLKPVRELSRPALLGWAVLKTGDRSLYNASQQFLQRIEQDGTLARLNAFYGDSNALDDFSARAFRTDLAARLPRYQPHFERTAAKNDMDWRLLAAIAYQESHWQAGAVSPTGVQGIMMLTADTASDMGVANRTNARQSIEGGTSYFRQIRDRLPASVREPDRTWMALAAYNMGPGHLYDARDITQRQGDNPDSWLAVSKHLSKLAQPTWYQNAKHGYSRNTGQALVYVQNIRRYYDTLVLATERRSYSDEHMASLSAAR